LVCREFRPAGPNQLWVADLTEIQTWGGKLYLAVVVDCYSRRCVGWAMAEHMRAELVVEALEMAVWQRKPAAGLVRHSDQGSQYTALIFGRSARKAGIAVSIGSRGSALDNAVCEAFFASLKKEGDFEGGRGGWGVIASPPSASRFPRRWRRRRRGRAFQRGRSSLHASPPSQRPDRARYGLKRERASQVGE
jgi:transposase InsO family protein